MQNGRIWLSKKMYQQYYKLHFHIKVMQGQEQ